jgi:hypothetical protein
LRNPSSAKRDRYLIEGVAVLDVFQLLAGFPGIYFDGANRNPAKSIRALLAPIYKGNRFHIAKKKAAVTAAIKEFATAYRDVMTAAESFAEEFYSDVAAMKASIRARAEFENKFSPLLYWHDYVDTALKSITEFKQTGDLGIIRDLVDRRVSASLRNIDALLAQGEFARMTGGGFEIEMRSISGINYSVRAWNDDTQASSGAGRLS